jgi:hypothetical protein
MISNITNYKNTGDWLYLVAAVTLVDFIVIVLAKYPGDNPLIRVKSLNEWYERFGVFAVGSDILSILIGILVTRYIFTVGGFKNPLLFLVILVLFQLAHDLFFYFLIINGMPEGHNQMIDVFKAYGQENGGRILVADSLMMLSSVVIASYLKSVSPDITISTFIVTLYALCYIVYTRKPNISL